MFYSKGMSHLGFPLEKIKGHGDDNDNYGDSTLFPFLSSIQPRYAMPHKAAPT